MRRTWIAIVALVNVGAQAQQPGPPVADLDTLYISRTPKYPGYLPRYDLKGKEGQPILVRAGTSEPMTREEIAARQMWPKEGERVTYTAVVENKGTTDSQPFDWAWYVDGMKVAEGKAEKGLKPGERTEFTYVWPWKKERHEIAFWADPMARVRQYSYVNDRRTVWTHAKLLVCYVDRVTYDSFARSRNFLGTYSCEDWLQAHADWMNHLYSQSIYPKTVPEGVQDRMAVDFIGVLEDDAAHNRRWTKGPPLSEGYDGGWWIGRNPDCSKWAAYWDWGLIHEWGHQMGLTDLYALNIGPENNQIRDAKGVPLLIGRHNIANNTMMHNHGPWVFSEDQAIALNHQIWRRRGYYGDYYYQLAQRNYVKVLDSGGKPVEGAKLRFWQSQADVHGFGGEPTFAGTTGKDGRFLLPSRPAPEVITYPVGGGGYRLKPNPFGLINVVGGNGVFFVEVVARGQTDYVTFDVTELNVECARQGATDATLALTTQLPVADAPPAPEPPSIRKSGREVTLGLKGSGPWAVMRADPVEYRWKVIGEPSEPTYTDTLPGTGLYRYAIATKSGGTVGARSQPVGVASMTDPWGIALAPDGSAYIRDRANGQTLMILPDGSAVGYLGSVHWHFEGSVDHATDAKGMLYVAKWPDGYDPKNARIRRIDPRGKGTEYGREDLVWGPWEDSAPGHFREPRGIWVSPDDGTIVVADTGNDRVQVFDNAGKLQSVVMGLNKPWKAMLASGKLVVCDTGAGRVVVFRREGDSWREEKAIGGFAEPSYLCAGPGITVWVADRKLGRVYSVSTEDWTKDGWSYPAEFEPGIEDLRGIAYDSRRRLLLYVDGRKLSLETTKVMK